MRVLVWIGRCLRRTALGGHLREALRRNDEAAAQLDAAVKEVLGK
ncbi:MAG: hypothetical protein AAGA71_12200 [Pseudomonadota bacterium]